MWSSDTRRLSVGEPVDHVDPGGTVDRVAGDGIDVSSPVGVPTVSGNIVTNASNVAISISGRVLDMGALDGNSGGAVTG